ncbi:hypothetical protein GCK32_017039, partial [Trichostrongylus colubriformis]
RWTRAKTLFMFTRMALRLSTMVFATRKRSLDG